MVTQLHDYERRSRVSEACIRIIDHNLDRPSLRELTGVTMQKRHAPDVDDENEEDRISKVTKKIKIA